MDYRQTNLNAGQYNKLMDDIFTRLTAWYYLSESC